MRTERVTQQKFPRAFFPRRGSNDLIVSESWNHLPAKTNNIPLTNVRFLLLALQFPTKHTVPPIRRITRLERGNQVDRLIVTEIKRIRKNPCA